MFIKFSDKLWNSNCVLCLEKVKSTVEDSETPYGIRMQTNQTEFFEWYKSEYSMLNRFNALASDVGCTNDYGY